jgi:hypothetical protein
MSERLSKRRIAEGVIVGVILFPFSFEAVRTWFVSFTFGVWDVLVGAWNFAWNGFCAFGRWLATPITLPLWLLILIAIGLAVSIKVAHVFRERARMAEGRPADVRVERVEVQVPVPTRRGRQSEPEMDPDFQPSNAQRRIIEHLARTHPGSQNLNDLHYSTRLPTQAHTEREVEALVVAGVVSMGSDYIHGRFFGLTTAGRDYALDNGMFPGGR